MRKTCFFCLLTVSGALWAQNGPNSGPPTATVPASPDRTLNDLQKEADKKGEEWDALAKGLETKISRLLPCDQRVRGAIEEVSAASEARLSALKQYLDAATATAKLDLETLQRLIAGQPAFAAEMNAERTDAEQSRDGIETQLTALGESVARRSTLDDAQASLGNVASVARQRAMQSAELAAVGNSFTPLLKELDAAFQSREKALESEVAALASERTHWSEYYAARLLRSQTECSITNVSDAPAPKRTRPGKKQ